MVKLKEPLPDKDMEDIIFNRMKPVLVLCHLFKNGKEIMTPGLRNYIKL